MEEKDRREHRRSVDDNRYTRIESMLGVLTERTTWIDTETKKCLADRNILYDRTESIKETVEILKVKQSLFFWIGGVMVSFCTLVCGSAAGRWLFHMIANNKTPHT